MNTPLPKTEVNETAIRQTLEVKYRFWWSVVLRLALIFGGMYVFWRSKTILTTLIVALVLSCAAEPLVEFLMRALAPVKWLHPHTRKAVAAGLSYAFLLCALALAVYFLITPFQAEFRRLISHLPDYQATLQREADLLQDRYPDIRRRIELQMAKFSFPDVTVYLTGFLRNALQAGSHIVEAILIPVLAFYFTLDGKRLRNQFMFLVPAPKRRQTLAILEDSRYIMRAYIVSQFWLATIAGVLVSSFLGIIGMDYAIVLGLFAGITRAIPVIGPLLGGIPLTLLTFVYGAQHGDPYLWVKALTFFTIMHLAESKIITPLFLGHALNLHAVVIIVVLLLGGEFFGLMGMFLAAPVAALLRILLDYYVIRPRQVRRGHKAPPGPKNKGRTLRLERALRVAGLHPSLPPVPLTASGPNSPTPSKD